VGKGKRRNKCRATQPGRRRDGEEYPSGGRVFNSCGREPDASCLRKGKRKKEDTIPGRFAPVKRDDH